MVEQGDLYWADFGPVRGSSPAGSRPCLVVQNDILNVSRINSVIVCTLTTNLARAGTHGNVLLDLGEGGLPERSVVNVSQIFTLDREDLLSPIGTLDRERMAEVIAGIKLILEP